MAVMLAMELMVQQCLEVGGGGRSWSWDRTVIGGKGGNANSTQAPYLGINSDGNNDDCPETNTNLGWDAGDGEDCGIVAVNGDIEVYAFGGSGASGGSSSDSAGGGGRWISSSRNRSVEELAGGRS